MQSIFRLPWCTDPSGDDKSEKAMFPKMRQPPVVDISLLSKIKRKRTDSPPFEHSPSMDHSKRRKFANADSDLYLSEIRQRDALDDVKLSAAGLYDSARCGSQDATASVPLPTPETYFVASAATKPAPTPLPTAKPQGKSDANEKSKSSVETQQPKLHEVLEHQFNLEILLKHRELRLIEQELAKCQTALEQLRRCELVPYPGASGLSESISSGTGPAIKPQPGFTQPQAPAPWGVTDGPYTRHYARWLLNDSTFDSVPFSQTVPSFDSYATQPEGRATRNSGSAGVRTGRSRSMRDSFGNLNQALPNYPVQSRGKQGPLVIKRLADNQFVKLICNNCQRGDFSSVQGFLNHCRIAHKVDYKSHEAAALDCGKPLEEDESHLIPQGAPAPTSGLHKPQQVQRPVAPQAVTAPPAGFVHPLNAQVLPRYTWKRQAEEARASAASNQDRCASANKPSISSAAASFHAKPLVGSSCTPYLSARFAKQGLGGDLKQAAIQAREKIDLGPDPADDEQSVSTKSEKSMPNGNSAMGGSRSVNTPKHDGSQGHKGWYSPIQRPRPAPIMARHVAAEMIDSPPDLSPHAVDSNPGLVSDHEDDDVPSDSDDVHSERHRSPGAVSGLGALRERSCGDGMDMDIEVDVDDEADGHSVLIRPRSLGLQMRPSGSPSRAK